MTTVFRAADLPSAQLDEALLGPPSATPLSGPITVRSHLAYKSDDNHIVSGTWESEPGTSRWEFLNRGEVITVVEGRMTVAEDNGEPVELTAGDTAYFPLGWTGIWTVHERLRKIFVVYTAPQTGASTSG
ncbi:cupin domain-containing protein [Streptomyces sp. NBC_01231]|nr:cupin domain-containing protein [Streptomyces sp. NBC_01231]